jgi:hypothetical protein
MIDRTVELLRVLSKDRSLHGQDVIVLKIGSRARFWGGWPQEPAARLLPDHHDDLTSHVRSSHLVQSERDRDEKKR